MTKVIIAFWLGFAAHWGVMWLSTHPEDRKLMFSRIKGLIHKNDKDAAP